MNLLEPNYVQQITIDTDLTADQIRERLLPHLETKKFLWASSKRYGGKLADNVFSMHKIISTRGGGPYANIDGVISDKKLTVTFRYNYVKAWSLYFVLLAILTVLMIGSWIPGTHLVGAPGTLLLLMLVLFFIPIFGIGTEHPRLIKNVAKDKKCLKDYFNAH